MSLNDPKQLSKMSIEELQQLEKNVAVALAEGHKKRRDDALEAAKKAAGEFGFSLDEVLEKPRKKTRGKTAGSGVPKYQNPDDKTMTWTGFGRKPNWIVEALGAGFTLDDMLIQKENA